MRRAGWVGAGSVVITGLFAMLIIAGSGSIAVIYTSEIEVQLILIGVLPLVAWVSIADGLQTVLLAATRGVADTVVPTLLQAISFWAVMVPLCYYLSHVAKMGVQGLFTGIGIAVLVASAMLAIRSTCSPPSHTPGLIHLRVFRLPLRRPAKRLNKHQHGTGLRFPGDRRRHFGRGGGL
jgi:Na+-driven multidrug efflux pump